MQVVADPKPRFCSLVTKRRKGLADPCWGKVDKLGLGFENWFGSEVAGGWPEQRKLLGTTWGRGVVAWSLHLYVIETRGRVLISSIFCVAPDPLCLSLGTAERVHGNHLAQLPHRLSQKQDTGSVGIRDEESTR